MREWRRHTLSGKPMRHTVWPFNPVLMYCPKDGKMHRGGCAHARRHQRLIPQLLRAQYQAIWSREQARR